MSENVNLKKKSGFFEDDNGNRSSARLRAFIVVMVITLVWAFVAIRNTAIAAPGKADLPAIPESVALFGAGMAGITLASRVYGEKPPDPPKEG